MAVAVVAYGIQGSLQSIYARKHDAFVVVLYRNLSLAITMLPILFFVPLEEVLEVRNHWVDVILASSTGALSLLCAMNATRYLPIGVGSAIRQIIQIVFSIVIGMLFLAEYLTLAQFLFLSIIVLVGVALATIKVEHTHLDPKKTGKGIALSFLAGSVLAVSFYHFSVLSREIHPLVAGYAWETGVGIFALLYFFFFVAAGRHSGRLSIPLRDAAKIIGVALFTIVGTGCYAFAVNYGPFPLAAGLLAATTLVASVIGWLVHKEKLTKLQLGLIVVAVISMVSLRIYS